MSRNAARAAVPGSGGDTVMRSPLPRTRRNAELALIILGWIVTGVGLLVVDQSTVASITDASVRIFSVYVLSGLVAHLVIRARTPHADPVLLPAALLLNGLGLIGIHRLDIANQLRATLRDLPVPSPDAVAQSTWTATGIVLLCVVLLAITDHRRLQRYTWTTMLAGFALLLLPLAPVIGREIRGATLWISIAGFSFQPAELAKIALTIAFAGYLAVYGTVLASVRERFLGLDLPRPRDLGPLVVAWLISLGVLVFQRDLGTSLLFFGLFVVLLYVATQRRTWPIIGALLFIGGSFAAWRLFGHVQTRVSLWLDPFQGDGTSQVALGLYGLAGGGMFGTGLGQGYPQIVPFAESDFIFATLGEELGIVGAIAILVLFAVIVQRGLRLAYVSRDGFSTLLATGLSTVIGLQAFVVIGGVTRLIPLTGLTTPFLSYGGSSLVANWAIVGLLLRMSHAARRPVSVGEPDEPALSGPRFSSTADTQVIER
jgi:cell division protein FtsW (lipid II flippase)